MFILNWSKSSSLNWPMLKRQSELPMDFQKSCYRITVHHLPAGSLRISWKLMGYTTFCHLHITLPKKRTSRAVVSNIQEDMGTAAWAGSITPITPNPFPFNLSKNSSHCNRTNACWTPHTPKAWYLCCCSQTSNATKEGSWHTIQETKIFRNRTEGPGAHRKGSTSCLAPRCNSVQSRTSHIPSESRRSMCESACDFMGSTKVDDFVPDAGNEALLNTPQPHSPIETRTVRSPEWKYSLRLRKEPNRLDL